MTIQSAFLSAELMNGIGTRTLSSLGPNAAAQTAGVVLRITQDKRVRPDGLLWRSFWRLLKEAGRSGDRIESRIF